MQTFIKITRPDGEPSGIVNPDCVQWIRPIIDKHGENVCRIYFKDNQHEQYIQPGFSFLTVDTGKDGTVVVKESEKIYVD